MVWWLPSLNFCAHQVFCTNTITSRAARFVEHFILSLFSTPLVIREQILPFTSWLLLLLPLTAPTGSSSPLRRCFNRHHHHHNTWSRKKKKQQQQRGGIDTYLYLLFALRSVAVAASAPRFVPPQPPSFARFLATRIKFIIIIVVSPWCAYLFIIGGKFKSPSSSFRRLLLPKQSPLDGWSCIFPAHRHRRASHEFNLEELVESSFLRHDRIHWNFLCAIYE